MSSEGVTGRPSPTRSVTSLQRKLLLIVAIGTPVAWLAALAVGLYGSSKEVNELFDTQQVRVAQLIHSILRVSVDTGDALLPSALAGRKFGGSAELEDVAVAVWRRDGRPRLSEQTDVELPFRSGPSGFEDRNLGEDWRIFYLDAPDIDSVVAVGQRLYERTELLRDLLLAQLLPWLAMLALLLAVLFIGVRRTLAPVIHLASEIESRPSSDLRPLEVAGLPTELAPLGSAINRLFDRVVEAMEHDRRFTADAAHELRTPIAAIQAQWDVLRQSTDARQREAAAGQVSRGLERLSGLVSQLLALARLDAVAASSFGISVDWAEVTAAAIQATLPLADERNIDIGLEWRTSDPLPLLGNADLVGAALRNLVDNAVRYAPQASRVTLILDSNHVSVCDDGAGVAEAWLPRLGDRFFRGGGQQTQGSGLGLSIAGRIAQMHALVLVCENRAGGGFTASLQRRGASDASLRLRPTRIEESIEGI